MALCLIQNNSSREVLAFRGKRLRELYSEGYRGRVSVRVENATGEVREFMCLYSPKTGLAVDPCWDANFVDISVADLHDYIWTIDHIASDRPLFYPMGDMRMLQSISGGGESSGLRQIRANMAANDRRSKRQTEERLRNTRMNKRNDDKYAG